MKILVTGGCGFIGANLINLIKDDYVVLDNLSTGHNKVSNLIKGDIRNKKDINKVIKDVDKVIHLAAHTDVITSVKEPFLDFDVNALGTLNLLQASVDADVKHFVFASSGAALGEKEPPINEKMIPTPISPYGASKLTGEAYCNVFNSTYGLKTSVLRFSNVYGPLSDHKTSVITKFFNMIKDGKTLTIYGDGEQTRDFIYAEDICRAILDAKHGLYQIGTGVETTINQLVSLLKQVTGNDFKTVNTAPMKGEIRRNYFDISKASKDFGFEPKVKLVDGLRRVWEWIE